MPCIETAPAAVVAAAALVAPEMPFVAEPFGCSESSAVAAVVVAAETAAVDVVIAALKFELEVHSDWRTDVVVEDCVAEKAY